MKEFIAVLLFLLPTLVLGADLRGGKKPVEEAWNYANGKYEPIDTEEGLEVFITTNRLVRLENDRYLEVDEGVSRPYVRPETRIFVRAVAEYSFSICGEPLVITSALRLNTDPQPRNGHKKSVHPRGMAVDVRLPNRQCRKDFEIELLYLELKGLIQATKERSPPHYHVVVYGAEYSEYISSLAKRDRAWYEIRPGDTLSAIADRFGTTVQELVIINGLDSPNFLSIGQKIRLR